MKFDKILIVVIFLVFLSGLIIGGAFFIKTKKPQPSSSAVPNMANPASVNCEQKGGSLKIRTAEDGSQTGFCKFKDGTECEEWAYLNGSCKPGQ